MPDYRFSDEVMMSQDLMDIPMFSIPMPFTMTIDLLKVISSADFKNLSPDTVETAELMYAMLTEHAVNNYPLNLRSS